jgi:hypothetical protein
VHDTGAGGGNVGPRIGAGWLHIPAVTPYQVPGARQVMSNLEQALILRAGAGPISGRAANDSLRQPAQRHQIRPGGAASDTGGISAHSCAADSTTWPHVLTLAGPLLGDTSSNAMTSPLSRPVIEDNGRWRDRCPPSGRLAGQWAFSRAVAPVLVMGPGARALAIASPAYAADYQIESWISYEKQPTRQRPLCRDREDSCEYDARRRQRDEPNSQPAGQCHRGRRHDKTRQQDEHGHAASSEQQRANRARLVPLKTRDAATAAIPRNRPHPSTLGAHGTARRSANLGTDSSPQRTTVSCHHGRLHKVCRHAERYPDCAKHQTDQAPYALGGRSAEVDRDEDSKKRERVDQTDRNREVVRAYSSYDGKRFGDI